MLVARYTPAPESPVELEGVRTSLIVPYPADFDLVEPINLTAWSVAEDYENPQEFRDFRRFTSSIPLHEMEMDVATGYEPLGRFHGSHFLVHDLLVDANSNCKEHLLLLSNAMKTGREILTAPLDDDLSEFQYVDDYCVCFTFGLLYLSQLLNDWDASEKYATQLILDVHGGSKKNDEVVDYPTERLYWHEGTKKNWRQMIGLLKNPTNHNDTGNLLQNLRMTADNVE